MTFFWVVTVVWFGKVFRRFRRTDVLKVRAISETSVNFHQATRRHTPWDMMGLVCPCRDVAFGPPRIHSSSPSLNVCVKLEHSSFACKFVRQFRINPCNALSLVFVVRVNSVTDSRQIDKKVRTDRRPLKSTPTRSATHIGQISSEQLRLFINA